APCSEHGGQTDHGRSVSGAVTRIDVVAVQDLTGELLSDEIHLVRGLATAEQPDPVAAVPLRGGTQPGRGPVESLVPGRDAQRAVVADHRLGESRGPVRHRAAPFHRVFRTDSRTMGGCPAIRRDRGAFRPPARDACTRSAAHRARTRRSSYRTSSPPRRRYTE